MNPVRVDAPSTRLVNDWLRSDSPGFVRKPVKPLAGHQCIFRRGRPERQCRSRLRH
jgi:hypothetical protein